jgi:hypothetical protein
VRSAFAELPLGAPRPRPVEAGVCRVCGCTDAESCVTKWAKADGKRGRPPSDPVARAAAMAPAETCFWIDVDLCSRCHGPRHLTRRQRGEIVRLQRYGRVRIHRAFAVGGIVVELLDHEGWATIDRGEDTRGRQGRFVQLRTSAPRLTLNPAGKIVTGAFRHPFLVMDSKDAKIPAAAA